MVLSVLCLKDVGIASTSVEKSMHMHEREIKITECGVLFITITTGINAYDSNVKIMFFKINCCISLVFMKTEIKLPLGIQ